MLTAVARGGASLVPGACFVLRRYCFVPPNTRSRLLGKDWGSCLRKGDVGVGMRIWLFLESRRNLLMFGGLLGLVGSGRQIPSQLSQRPLAFIS